jgi:hypothetical protein
LLISLGSNLEGEVADFELGLSEERGWFSMLKSTNHVADFVFDELGEFHGQLLGGDFLLGSRLLLHNNLTDKRGGFFGKTSDLLFVYKNSTNFRDAHTANG